MKTEYIDQAALQYATGGSAPTPVRQDAWGVTDFDTEAFIVMAWAARLQADAAHEARPFAFPELEAATEVGQVRAGLGTFAQNATMTIGGVTFDLSEELHARADTSVPVNPWRAESLGALADQVEATSARLHADARASLAADEEAAKLAGLGPDAIRRLTDAAGVYPVGETPLIDIERARSGVTVEIPQIVETNAAGDECCTTAYLTAPGAWCAPANVAPPELGPDVYAAALDDVVSSITPIRRGGIQFPTGPGVLRAVPLSDDGRPIPGASVVNHAFSSIALSVTADLDDDSLTTGPGELSARDRERMDEVFLSREADVTGPDPEPTPFVSHAALRLRTPKAYHPGGMVGGIGFMPEAEADALISSFAKKHDGQPYDWGARADAPGDCSGFLGAAYDLAVAKKLPPLDEIGAFRMAWIDFAFALDRMNTEVAHRITRLVKWIFRR